jgi:hypothetical protein
VAVVQSFELKPTRIGPAFRPTDCYVRTAVTNPIAERNIVEMPIASEVLGGSIAVPNGVVDSPDQIDLRGYRV